MLTFKQYLNEEISSDQLAHLEKLLNEVFRRVGLEVDFTPHFFQRVNDSRNGRPITVAEVNRLFLLTYNKYAKQLSQVKSGFQAVLRDMRSEINIPIQIEWNPRFHRMRIAVKTVMRKKDFIPNNPAEKVINV